MGEFKGQIYTTNNFFADRRRKVDFVLVSDLVKTADELDKLSTFIANLCAAGVQYEIAAGRVHSQLVFIKLHCPLHVLIHQANIQNYLFDCQHPREMPVARNAWFRCRLFHNVATRPDVANPAFARAISSLSAGKSSEITSWERSLIVEKMLMRTRFGEQEKEVGIEQMKVAAVICDAYPTHDGPWEWRRAGPLTDRQLLNAYWANLRCALKNQPIRLIYKYYGPEVAFYFAFIDYYTKMLLIPTGIGVACFFYNAATYQYIDAARITEICTSKTMICPNCYHPTECDFMAVRRFCTAAQYNALFDNFVGIGFAIFTSMWATIFLGLWQRREFYYKFHWNLLNCEIDSSRRVEFAHNAKHTHISPLSGERENYMPHYVMFFKYAWSALVCIALTAVVLLCLLIVVFGRFAISSFAWWEQKMEYQTIIDITVTAIESIIIIQILAPQFRKAAEYLTREENPAMSLDFYNSCTYKFYYLSFVNNYTPIFYIAFVKGLFFTYPSDKNNYNLFGLKTDLCVPIGCGFSLTVYLLCFMGYKTFLLRAYQLICLGVRKLLRKIKMKRKRQRKPHVHAPAWERDYKLRSCGDLFLMNNFMELAIQYGMVVFFIAGFPLTPLMAVIANIVQIRLDAQKIIRDHRRPVAKLVPGIGAWNSIFRLVTFVGAITNPFVIAFTSDLIDMEVYRLTYKTLTGYINSTLSEFLINDYPEEFNDILSQAPVEVCAYKARRNPYYHPKKYRVSNDHWRAMCFKLCFVLVFQQMIWLLNAICASTITPVSDEVLEELNDEAVKLRDVRFQNLLKNYHNLFQHEHEPHFEIA